MTTRFFADHGARHVISTENGLIASTIVSDGRHPEITPAERDRLLGSGWTSGAHPRSIAALFDGRRPTRR